MGAKRSDDWVHVLAGFIGLGLLVWWLGSTCTALPTGTTPAPPAVQSASARPGVGELARLTTGGSGRVPVGRDKEAYDLLTKAVLAKDSIGVDELRRDGRIIRIAEGTEVLVIDSDWFMLRVRLREGPYAGEAVWVDVNFVKRP